MSTEERRVQLVAEVDTTRTRTGFQEIGQQAGQMAQQVTRAGEQAERAVTGVGGGATTSARSVDGASRSIVASIQRTTAAMEAGGRQTAAYYELMARQRGIDPNTIRPYLDQLRAVEQAQARTGASSAQVANAMRMVPAQLSDIAVQLAGGQSPLMVLMQQGSQLRDSFGSIPATIRGVGASLLNLVNPYTVAAAAAGALAYAYSEGSKEADAYTRSIIMSANAAGASASQMATYASAISKAVGTQAEAAQAVAALVGTGQVGAENLKQFGTVAVQVQKYIGRSVEETVKDFQELGKSPVQASLKLSESYSYLTGAVYEQIKALQDQGKTEEAAEVAQKAYATAFADRAAKLKDNLGLIERAWMGAKDSAASAWDVFLGVGRKKTPAQELAEVQAQIALARQPAGTGGGDRGDAAEMRRAAAASKLTELLKRESDLQKQIEKESADAQEAAAKEKLRQAQLAWSQIMETTVSQAKRQEDEIKAVIQKGTDAGADPSDIKKAVDKVKEKYFALNNVTLTQLENNRNLQKEKMAGELADAESQYKRQLISQDEYYAKKRDIQLREIDLEIPILREQARIADGKEEKSAREKANGELAVLMQKRANIISGAANAIKDADFERNRSIDDVVVGWSRTIAAERDAVAQELILFGQSDQARRAYLAQRQIELEMERKIQERKNKGLGYTKEEIDRYRAEAEAAKASTAKWINEQAALTAANQLLRDNEKFSAQYIADTDLRAQRITAIDAKQWQYLIDHTEEGSEARKKILEQFDIWMANRQMQPVLDRWKGVIDNLDNNFQEGFRDMLTSGQNAWSSFAKAIGNTLKTSLADALYQTFIKKYVVQIVASMAGVISGPAVASTLAGTSTAAGAVGSGVASTGSAVGTAAGMASLFGAGGVGGSLAAGAGWLTGATTLTGSLGAAGSLIGTGTTAGIASGIGMGLGAIAPIALGILAGSALLKKAFGMGDKQVTSQGISGTLSASSLTGQNYTTWHQDGGWFRSDKNGTDTTALTDAMVKQFTQGLSAIESASTGFASALGVQADWIKDYSKVFDLKLTGDATKDQQAITDFFSGIGDEIAQKLVPNLDDLSKSGETASAALERLANDFKGTDQIAQLLGFSASSLFGSAGLDSAKAREQLIDMAGGLQVLSGYASTFNQNFLTDAERIKPVAEALDKALASLGLSTIPTTRDEFKALVNSLITSGAAATESGAKQLDSLLALAEAFAQVHPAADAAAEAVDKAVEALQAMKDSASTLLGGVDSAYSVLEKVVGREKAAIQTTVDAHSEAVSRLQGLSQALHSTLDSMLSPEQKLLERARAQAEIRADLAITKAGGTLSDAQTESLKKALSAVTQDASSQFSSYSDYLRDLAQTQNDIGALAGLTDDSLSVEQKALAAAQDQLKSLDAILTNAQNQIDELKGQSISLLSVNDALGGLTTAILAAQANPIVSATSGINQAYQQMLGRTPDAAGLEYWQQVAAGGTSINAIKDSIGNSAEAQVRKLYQDLLGRPADAGGLDYYLHTGASISAIADSIKQSDEYKKLHPFAVGTNFVPETMPALVHQGERIIPAADNRVLMSVLARASSGGGVDVSVLVTEMQELRKENAQLRQTLQDGLRAIAGHTSDTSSQLDDLRTGRVPLLVQVIQEESTQ